MFHWFVVARTGSSAHAEMHPCRRLRRRSRARFLRARGDAPRLACAAVGTSQVPPRTRRCTLRAGLRLDRQQGSSAHAEMHPATPSRSICCARFLRARGDAPHQQPKSSGGFKVLRARGHALSIGVRGGRGAGSSAHAEMHPSGRRAGAVEGEGSPVHARRCTRGRRHAARPLPGSSAHAEMHPGRGWLVSLGTRFLRARGDAPPRRRPSQRTGSSAHAEMHPPRTMTAVAIRWFLRARGDAPTSGPAGYWTI